MVSLAASAADLRKPTTALPKDQVGTVVRRERRWYVPAAVSGGTPMKRCGLMVILSALVLAACGGDRLDVNEPRANFTVSVPTESFPASQTMSEHIHLRLGIRNDSNKTIPNVNVTICNVTCLPGPGQTYQDLAQTGEGVYAQPFGTAPRSGNNASTTPPSTENPAYQIWVVDRPPGPCTGRQGYSCAGGSFGGNVSHDANTREKGPLKPRATTT